ncbi:MAG: hypothetical protein IJR68_05620 [Fretibacterium sp.]|nr:hypothetical protein [Fretibacterium sp.]
MSSHTPGPWKFNPINDTIEDKDRETVCEFSCLRKKGDAFLMAAAQEMYGSLEKLALVAMNYYLHLQVQRDEMLLCSEHITIREHLEMQLKSVKYELDKANALLRRIEGKDS